jgi:hypothetical protein
MFHFQNVEIFLHRLKELISMLDPDDSPCGVEKRSINKKRKEHEKPTIECDVWVCMRASGSSDEETIIPLDAVMQANLDTLDIKRQVDSPEFFTFLGTMGPSSDNIERFKCRRVRDQKVLGVRKADFLVEVSDEVPNLSDEEIPTLSQE